MRVWAACYIQQAYGVGKFHSVYSQRPFSVSDFVLVPGTQRNYDLKPQAMPLHDNIIVKPRSPPEITIPGGAQMSHVLLAKQNGGGKSHEGHAADEPEWGPNAGRLGALLVPHTRLLYLPPPLALARFTLLTMPIVAPTTSRAAGAQIKKHKVDAYAVTPRIFHQNRAMFGSHLQSSGEHKAPPECSDGVPSWANDKFQCEK